MKLSKNLLIASASTLAIAASFMLAGNANAQLGNDPLLGTGETANNLGLSSQTDIKSSVVKIIKYVLGFLGLAGVVLVIYGGVVWMTAAGNEDKVADAKKIIYTALVGLIVVLFAFSITSFVLTQFAAQIK